MGNVHTASTTAPAPAVSTSNLAPLHQDLPGNFASFIDSFALDRHRNLRNGMTTGGAEIHEANVDRL